jgi:hypothetical protein
VEAGERVAVDNPVSMTRIYTDAAAPLIREAADRIGACCGPTNGGD